GGGPPGSRAAVPGVGRDAATAIAADEVLAGRSFEGRVIVWDDEGRYRGPGAALRLAAQGAQVEIVTPDLHVGIKLDPSNLVPFYRHLFEAGVQVTPRHEGAGGTGRA